MFSQTNGLQLIKTNIVPSLQNLQIFGDHLTILIQFCSVSLASPLITILPVLYYTFGLDPCSGNASKTNQIIKIKHPHRIHGTIHVYFTYMNRWKFLWSYWYIGQLYQKNVRNGSHPSWRSPGIAQPIFLTQRSCASQINGIVSSFLAVPRCFFFEKNRPLGFKRVFP